MEDIQKKKSVRVVFFRTVMMHTIKVNNNFKILKYI